MRHDPASAAIVIMLRSLKMYGMAQAVTDLSEQGAPAFEAAVPILSQLLKAELAEHEVRSIAYHMNSARFPAYKDLSGFDFAASEINEATVRQLHKCEFLDGAQNVVLIGGPGTGKTHAATALGLEQLGQDRHGRIERWRALLDQMGDGLCHAVHLEAAEHDDARSESGGRRWQDHDAWRPPAIWARRPS